MITSRRFRRWSMTSSCWSAPSGWSEPRNWTRWRSGTTSSRLRRQKPVRRRKRQKRGPSQQLLYASWALHRCKVTLNLAEADAAQVNRSIRRFDGFRLRREIGIHPAVDMTGDGLPSPAEASWNAPCPGRTWHPCRTPRPWHEPDRAGTAGPFRRRAPEPAASASAESGNGIQPPMSMSTRRDSS